MNSKGNVIQITSILLLIIILCMFYSCAPKDPSDIASKVAEEWASNNVDDVSRSIAGLLAKNNPLLETAIAMGIGNEIKQRIVWEYSQPQKLAEDRYKVVATASSTIELPLVGSYKVSVNYNLEIDTNHRKAISAIMDVSSFSFTKQ